MNRKIIFLDKVFWSRIWPFIAGCLSQSITISVSLIIIWWLNGSLASVLETDEIKRIIVISAFASVWVNGGILFVEALYRLKIYLFLMPIEPELGLKEIKDYVNDNQVGEIYTKYGVPFGLLFINSLFFLIPFVSGVKWEIALLNSALAVLPFHIAGLMIHIVKISLEIILLISRYIIRQYHY